MTAQAETAVKAAIRQALMRTERVRLFPNPQGFDSVVGRRYGLGAGSADLVGYLRCGCPETPVDGYHVGRYCGRWVEFEVKRPHKGSRAEKSQLAHAAVVRRDGGFYCFVRTVDEAFAALARAELGWAE